MSESLKLFGHSYNQVGDTGTDFVIKTRGLVKVQWGKKFIDIVKDGKLNVNADFIRRVSTKDDVETSDGLYITDAGEVYLVSGGVTIALFGEAGTTYVAYVGDLDTTQEAKLQALKNIGIVFPTMTAASAIVTEGFVYILEDKTFYTVENGVFTPYPSNEDSDVLMLDKRIITILNSGNQVINILDGIITIDAPIISSKHIQSPTFISDVFKSEGGATEKGFLVETKGGISTLYVDYLVVRKKSGEENVLNAPLKEINVSELGDPPEPELDDEGNEIPIAIVHNSEGWQYMKVVPWETFKKCCDEMKEATKKFTVSWYTMEGELYTTTQVQNNTTATAPSTNPTRKHRKFTGWDYDNFPITEDISIYAEWEYVPPKVYISVSPAYLTNLGGSATVSYYVEWDGEIITEGITVEGSYSNISYTEDGEAYILDNKVNRDLTVAESTYSVLGKIYFLAKFMGEEGPEEGMGEVTAETVLLQRPAGALALPNFDLMKFSAEWNNITTDDMTGVEEWTDNGDGTWKYATPGDLDIYTHTEGTNIPITESKTLDDYGVGFKGSKNMSLISIIRANPIIVRKNLTKIFDSSYNEVTKETIELYNLNYTDSSGNPSPRPADLGKDVYDLFLYLAWSGDNTSSGGEYTVLNFRKLINNIVRSGQKAVFVYMQAIWAVNYNGTGKFNMDYNIYKLNNEEKGLVSPANEYDFNEEDSSVERIEVSSNKLTGLYRAERTSEESYSSLSDYGNPIATLYYDLATLEITFIQGYYTEEDIYGRGSSEDTFIWTDIQSGS